MKLDRKGLMNHLLASVDQDIEAQERMLLLLAEQERTVLEEHPEGVVNATAAIESELESYGARREQLFSCFGELFGVPAGGLTLSMIVERFGAGSEGLARRRSRLRECTAKVVRKQRFVAALLREHRRFITDLLGLILTDETGNPVQEEGALIDARA